MERNMLQPPVRLIHDPMNFVMAFHQLMFAHKYVSPLVYGGCVIYAVLGVISLIHLILYDGMDLLLKYAIVPSTAPWALATAMTEYFWIQPGIAFIHKDNYWDVSSASEPKRSQMKKEIRISRFICTLFILDSSINTFFAFFIGYFSDVRADMYILSNVFADNSLLRIVSRFIANASHSVVTLSSISIYLVMKYFAVTSKIQFQLLSDYLGRIRIYGAGDDEAIRNHLKICAFQHAMLLDQFARVQAISYFPLIPSSVSASVAIFGCLICLYYNRSIQNILYVLLLQSLIGILLMDCCESGQDVEDAANFSEDLTNVEWYDWNETNKKTLLIMLMRSQKKEEMKALNTSFNRTLIIAIVRSAYQIFVLLQGRI